MMTIETKIWWALLCVIAAINLVAWAHTVRTTHARRATLGADELASRRLQLLLCTGYVFGCAFRSVLPVFDVPRMVIVDSQLSSVIVGRSVATVAELCFAAQWALVAHDLARLTGDPFGRRVAGLIVPAIAVAEMFSWYSVLTTSNAGHVVEESLWGTCALLLVASFLLMRDRCNPALRRRLGAWSAAGAVYAGYMFAVDVPMYFARWLEDEAAGRRYLTIADGVVDAATRWVVTHDWSIWQGEVVWMTAYFSAAVWLSIALVHTPMARTAVAGAQARGRLSPILHRRFISR